MNITDLKLPENISSEISDRNIETKIPVAVDKNGMLFFNLMSKVSIPYNINPVFYDLYTPKKNESFQTIAYKFYGNIKLWWVICETNKLFNITEGAAADVPLKIIKKQYIYDIIKEI